MKCLSLLLVALSAVLLGACREKTAQPASAAGDGTNYISGSPDVKFYLVRGVVKNIEAGGKIVSIQHEAIPGYMEAMTMPFRVKDLKELEGLQAGDTIWFRLWVAPTESWIDKVKKEAKPQPPAPQATAPSEPERESVRVVRDVAPLKVGDLMPDYQFTNELGRTVRLSEFRGQALAFTFFYTRCPLPDFCPRMSKNFAEVCQKLTALPNSPTNWHLLSISFDPHHDTPTVLRGYAQAFQSNPERWSFVTGAIEDIDAITDQFELTIVKQGTEWDHKLRTVVVDAAGRVQQIIYGNEWTPETLVPQIVKAASALRNPEIGRSLGWMHRMVIAEVDQRKPQPSSRMVAPSCPHPVQLDGTQTTPGTPPAFQRSGLQIAWTAPQEGTVILIDKTTRKAVATKSLNAIAQRKVTPQVNSFAVVEPSFP